MRRRVVLGLSILVAVIYLVNVAAFWPQINDDAYITFRYAKFLTLGRGPYYNVGEHVEGYTNPSMMLLMAAADALLGDALVPTAAKVIGAGAGLVTLLFTGLLCGAWLRKIPPIAPHAGALACLAPALVATQSGFVQNSTTGLETTLFSALSMGGVWLAQRGEDRDRWLGCGVVFALAALTRPEGAPVFAVAWAVRLACGAWRERRARGRLLLDAGIVAGAVAVMLLARFMAYDGDLLPNTYYAKAGGMGAQLTAAGYVLGFARRHLAYVGFVPALFVLGTTRRELLRSTLPALAVLCFAIAAIFLAGPDWMPGYRLLVPYVPLWAALCVTGISAIVIDRLAAWRVGIATAACAALFLVLVLAQIPAYASDRRNCLIRARGYVAGHAALADWLHDRRHPGETVALMDIGIVGFRCIDLTILDFTGLTDRFIARSPGSFLDKRFDASYLFDRRPDYIVLVLTGPPGRDPSDPGGLVGWSPIERRLAADPRFREAYVHPRTFAPDGDALETLAARIGAVRVFEHAHPQRSYFLCVFARSS